MIGQRGIPAAYGGVERHVEEISARLARRGHSVRVFGREGYCASPDGATGGPEGALLVPLRDWRRPAWGTAAHCLEASLRCLADPPDLVHFHATGPAACALLARLGSIPSVTTFHARDWRRRRWGAGARAVLRACEAAAVRGSRQVTAVSEPLARSLRERWRVPVTWIPNGVTLGPEPCAPPADSPPRLLFLGRLVEDKGVHHLVRALRILDADVRVQLAGPEDAGDPYPASLRRLAAGDRRIEFLGPLDAGARDRALADCSLLVLPSELEGMSLALLEAMAAGRPVLASDLEENRVLLVSGTGEPAGFLFRCGDAAGLAERLRVLLRQPERLRAAGAAARRRAGTLFDWERAVDQLEGVYERARETEG
jgi:glycosyltransferase involved in cell wall biosynthesis